MCCCFTFSRFLFILLATGHKKMLCNLSHGNYRNPLSTMFLLYIWGVWALLIQQRKFVNNPRKTKVLKQNKPKDTWNSIMRVSEWGFISFVISLTSMKQCKCVDYKGKGRSRFTLTLKHTHTSDLTWMFILEEIVQEKKRKKDFPGEANCPSCMYGLTKEKNSDVPAHHLSSTRSGRKRWAGNGLLRCFVSVLWESLHETEFMSAPLWRLLR